VRLAFVVIGLNVITQAVLFVMVRSGRMDSGRAINLAMWGGLAFYAVVLAMLAGPLLTLRPRWLAGNRETAPVLGIEVGLAAAAGLIALFWIGTGHPVLDPSARAMVSEGSLGRTLLAFVVIAGGAPVVEELLFRGVVAESLRRHGAVVAVGVSSFMFALAHLRGLGYYTLCGVVLGVLYWRRGLWASIAAHATFNGCLVVMAVVVALGPPVLHTAEGVSLLAPAGWQHIDSIDLPADSVLALDGPSGASLLVMRGDIPLSGRALDLDQMAAALNGGAFPVPPQTTITPGSGRVRTFPAGRGLEFSVTVRGHAGVVVLIPKGASMWEIDVATGGSARATREYPAILESLTLPSGGGNG